MCVSTPPTEPVSYLLTMELQITLERLRRMDRESLNGAAFATLSQLPCFEGITPNYIRRISRQNLEQTTWEAVQSLNAT